MGSVLSTNRLGNDQIPTLNNFRAAVQDWNDKNLSKILMLDLITKLNGIGIEVTAFNEKGKMRSLEELSNEIYNILKITDKCFIGSNDGSQEEQIKKLMPIIDIMDKYYGAKIQIYNDPRDINLGLRNTKNICMDIMTIQENAKRLINDDPKKRKNLLDLSMKQLSKLKTILADEFISK